MWRFKSPVYLFGLFGIGNIGYQAGESIYRYKYAEDNFDVKDYYSVHKKNTALITGGTSGLGKAYAQSLAKRGFNLILVSRTEQNLKDMQQDIQSEYGVEVNYYPFDITTNNIEDYEQLFNNLNQHNIQVFVNNAAVLEQGNILTNEQIQKQVNGNILSPTLLSNYFLDRQIAKGREDGEKRIMINVGSQSAQRGPISSSYPYFATKAYVNYLTDSAVAAQKINNQNLQIQNVSPGLIDSEMLYKFDEKYKNPNFFQKLYIQNPRDIAEASLTQINTNKVNGTFNQAVVNGLITYIPFVKGFFM